MSDNDNSSVAKNTAHWVAIAREKKHLEKLLHPERWKNNNDQAMLLGPTLWPAPAMSTAAAYTGLTYAFQSILDMHQAETERKTGNPTVHTKWVPLDTIDHLQVRLENVEADLTQAEEDLKSAEKAGNAKKKEEAEKDLEVAKQRVASVRKWMAACKRVGVWSDDYSNLLSVFLLSEDD